MTDLPEPLTAAGCDVGDTPFPHTLLVEMFAAAFGGAEAQAIEAALSVGWVRVPGGWKRGH